jgi:S-DNA-T family DNA segregation ATPase FtsK/SpoIIIE
LSISRALPVGGAPTVSERLRKLLRDCLYFGLLPLALFVLLAFVSYDSRDDGWSHASGSAIVRNLGGPAGAWIADLWLYLCGAMAYLFPIGMLIWALRGLRGSIVSKEDGHFDLVVRLIGLSLLLVSGCALLGLHAGESVYPAGSGGVLGTVLGNWIPTVIGRLGGTVVLLAIFLLGITLGTGMSWLKLMDRTGGWTLAAFVWCGKALRRGRDWNAGRQKRVEREEVRKEDVKRKIGRVPPKIEAPAPKIQISERVEREIQIPMFTDIANGDLPPLSLLDEPKPTGKRYSTEDLEILSRQVEVKLKEFRIEAQVVNVLPGPVITRFELQPAAGVRGSQISSLDKDIARGMSKVSVRVVDVIPGKSVVGLEIPNESRETVWLSEILRSREFDKATSPLTLALGKDISGRPVVADVGKMPHLLVAGTTGSGKSVALNAMILSFLYKASAQDMRMIMIDPKMLELSVYDGIPHLLAPVVTDMKEAANALRWCVAEMERRYKLMAAMGVRNLGGYNRKVKDALAAGQPIPDPLFNVNKAPPGAQPENLATLPYIVVVIDEFADMMMIVGKKVEELIARLAQKARAAGIHLILATQRPSVDVITGLIKANIPTRMAFQVSTKIDSRTILDQSGAETLLGHGDMLYLPPGTAQPERIHGAFVDDHEVHKVVAFLKQHNTGTVYNENILSDTQEMDDGRIIGETGLPEDKPSSESSDQLYDQAVRIVTESRRASISYVQRRLKIGYNRAARLIEEMETAGVVSTAEHNGDRQVLAPPPPSD